MESQNSNHSTRNILCLIVIFSALIIGGMFWMDYQEKKRQKALHELLLERAEALKSYEDSIAVDSLHRDSCSSSLEKDSPSQLSGAKNRSGSHPCADDDYDKKEDTKKHPGTSPDDGMFGFDYYDDEDDAYEMDRNQSDAYPDDW